MHSTLLLICLLYVVFGISNAFIPSSFAVRRISSSSLEMKVTGVVKFFDSVKGFGFITPSAGGEDIFVHQSAIHAQGFRSLLNGEEVEFDILEDKAKGKKFAGNVTGPNGSFVKGAPRRERDDVRY